MKNDEAMKLIQLMISMGFKPGIIFDTLYECELGKGIGHAFSSASYNRKNLEKCGYKDDDYA